MTIAKQKRDELRAMLTEPNDNPVAFANACAAAVLALPGLLDMADERDALWRDRDHNDALMKAQAEIERLRVFEENAALAFCSYCGDKYYKDETGSILAHIIQCPKRPETKLLERIAGLEGLLAEVRPFVDTDATAVVDELARRFYRDTGLMAPGKSVAPEMASSQPPDEVRREKYYEWVRVHRDAFCRAIDEALAPTKEPTDDRP